jgi:hypothetical protein
MYTNSYRFSNLGRVLNPEDMVGGWLRSAQEKLCDLFDNGGVLLELVGARE